MSTKKEKGSFLLKLLLIIIAFFAAYFFSLIPQKTDNYAAGFDGDTSKSGFAELSPTGSEVQDYLFSAEEADAINQAVKEMAGKLEMNIFVYASRTPIDDYDTEIFADDSYDEMFGPDTDGLFYYMDLSGKSPAYDYISTSGKAILTYEDCRDSIFYALDNFLPSSSDVQANGLAPYKDNIMAGIMEFLKKLDYYATTAYSPKKVFKSYVTGKYVYYNKGVLYVTTTRPPAQKMKLFFFCELIGFIVSWSFSARIRKKYFFVTTPNSRIYMSDNDVHFIQSEDTFLREHTSKTAVSSSSSGGHRSGGSHRSGGGTHGGGGHHR